MQSPEIDKLAAALSKAQGEVEGAAKDSTNPHFKSRYADLGNVIAAMREPFAKNGLSVHQGPRGTNGDLCLVTRVMHSSGQWIEDGGFPLMLDKANMQGLGSATTYARRYGLMSAAGIAPEDDDGNAAVTNDRPAGKTVQAKRGATKIKTTESLHISVPAPDDGGWPTWREGIEALLDKCTAHGNVKALYADNKPAFQTYAEEHPEAHASLGALFTAKRATFEEKAA